MCNLSEPSPYLMLFSTSLQFQNCELALAQRTELMASGWVCLHLPIAVSTKVGVFEFWKTVVDNRLPTNTFETRGHKLRISTIVESLTSTSQHGRHDNTSLLLYDVLRILGSPPTLHCGEKVVLPGTWIVRCTTRSNFQDWKKLQQSDRDAR